MRKLEGKVALVTGGGRGVGRAHAVALAAAGAHVLVNDLGCDLRGQGSDPSVAVHVAESIRKSGGSALSDSTDVGNAGGPALLVERAISQWGRLDIAVNCAGVSSDRTVLKMDDELLQRAIDVHIRGSFSLTRVAARAMIDRGEGGSILLHTSAIAFFGALRQSVASATGAAIVGLVRSAAIELRKHNIRINAIAPTARTRATEELPLFRGIAAGSMGPETVAPVAVFLASEESADVTGEVVGVAGARVYALGGRETPGWFAQESPVDTEALEAAWAQVTRA